MWGKIFFVVSVLVPVVLLGAVAYHMVKNRVEWGTAFYKAYYSVTGFTEFDEELPAAKVVLMCLQILGMSTFAG